MSGNSHSQKAYLILSNTEANLEECGPPTISHVAPLHHAAQTCLVPEMRSPEALIWLVWYVPIVPIMTGDDRSVSQDYFNIQGLVNVPFWGFFEHHLQISVGIYIPNSWVMFDWDIYQPLISRNERNDALRVWSQEQIAGFSPFTNHQATKQRRGKAAERQRYGELLRAVKSRSWLGRPSGLELRSVEMRRSADHGWICMDFHPCSLVHWFEIDHNISNIWLLLLIIPKESKDYKNNSLPT